MAAAPAAAPSDMPSRGSSAQTTEPAPFSGLKTKLRAHFRDKFLKVEAEGVIMDVDGVKLGQLVKSGYIIRTAVPGGIDEYHFAKDEDSGDGAEVDMGAGGGDDDLQKKPAASVKKPAGHCDGDDKIDEEEEEEEEEEQEDEEFVQKKPAMKTPVKKKPAGHSDDEGDEEEEEEEDDEPEEFVQKKPAMKTPAKKRLFVKTGAAKKRPAGHDADEGDEEEEEDEHEEFVQKKPAMKTPAKKPPAKKAKVEPKSEEDESGDAKAAVDAAKKNKNKKDVVKARKFAKAYKGGHLPDHVKEAYDEAKKDKSGKMQERVRNIINSFYDRTDAGLGANPDAAVFKEVSKKKTSTLYGLHLAGPFATTPGGEGGRGQTFKRHSKVIQKLFSQFVQTSSESLSKVV